LRKSSLPKHSFVPVAATLVCCYGKEPSLEAAIASELPQPDKRRHEYFLRDVLNITRPAQQPVGKSRNIPRVLLDNSVKRRIVTPVELFDQVIIVEHFCHGYNIRQP
jgi:hypothetical protein